MLEKFYRTPILKIACSSRSAVLVQKRTFIPFGSDFRSTMNPACKHEYFPRDCPKCTRDAVYMLATIASVFISITGLAIYGGITAGNKVYKFTRKSLQNVYYVKE